MTQLKISLLGPFEVTLHGERVTQFGSDTARALLAYLAMQPDISHQRDALSGLLWPEQPNHEALRNLRVALSRLRDAIGDRQADPPFLQITRQTIQLNNGAQCWVDAQVMAKALAATKTHAHPKLDECQACAEQHQVIADIYRGEFLESFALDSVSFEDWMVVEREHLHWQALEALYALTAYHETQGNYERAIANARRQVELEPWREVAYRQWMRALALSGHRGAALTQAAACRRVLAEELGVEPEAETVALIEQIRNGSVAPAASAHTDHTAIEAPAELESQPVTAATRKVEAVTPPPPIVQDIPDSERRVVTVVQVAMRGTDALRAHTDTENWAATISQLLHGIGAEVQRFGGEVDCYDVNSLVALFGADMAHEDDPERGVRAALGMQTAFKAQIENLAQETTDLQSGTAKSDLVDLALRIAVHTGEAVVTVVEGDNSTGRRAVLGDAISATQQLLARVAPGEVRVSEATYRLVAPLFTWAPPEDIDVGVNGYVPLSLQTDVGKGRGIPGMRSALVGRENALRTLSKAVTRLQSGIGGIVTLVGQAGIGKSRLVAECRAAVGTSVRWIEGRCVSYGETLSYLLWQSALRDLLKTPPDASPGVVGHTLRKHVHALAAEQRATTYAYLGRMLALPLDAQAEALITQMDAETLKNSTFYAMEHLLIHAAERKPLVVVCEDLHWADPTSLALLEYLLPLADRVPLLFVCIFRPQREHDCWQIREVARREYPHRHVDLQLDPLSPAEGAQLLKNLLHSLPGPEGQETVEGLVPELKHQILSRGEGNPFYIEEILRALICSGDIVCQELSCRWEAVQEPDEINIPETLYGVLRTRIDQLPIGARHVLQLAAVIGRIFPKRLLADIAERRTLEEHLVTLQREQMIRERARVPEAEYIFKHQLMFEAAYDGLLHRARRVLHQRVAEALERLYPDRLDEQLGLLAHHWEQAGNRTRAIDYLRRAGEKAEAQYAAEEAAAYYSRALALVPQSDRKGQYEFLMARSRVHRLRGSSDAQVAADLTKLQRLADALADPHKQAEVMLRQAEYAFGAEDISEGTAAAHKALEIAHSIGDSRIEALAHYTLGRVVGNFMDHDPTEAQQHIEQALALCQDQRLHPIEARILRWRGIILMVQADYTGAEKALERAVTLWRELGNKVEEGRTLNALSLVSMGQGKYQEARNLINQGYRLCQEMDNRYDEAWSLEARSRIMMAQGAYMDAKADAERCLSMFNQLRSEAGKRWTYVDLGRIHCHLGDYNTAIAHLEQVLEVSVVESFLKGWALATMGFVSHHRGDHQAAREYAQRAVQLAQKGHRRYYLPVLGYALIDLGQFDQAISVCEEAIALWEGLNLSAFASEPLAGLAHIALSQGDVSQAQTYTDRILDYLDDPAALHDTWDPLGIYLTCVHVLRANQDPRADEILRRAYNALQTRAAKIADPELQHTYLAHVPSHREIIDAYRRVKRDA